ncbi:adenylyltransferase/cytidyltransferase family protein [Marinifilum sp. RC60d5]|uniref:adenylyltransferase/cytidyltransferase family protein n=1 Tax=Marinifilum sp. RC60d5 TaxID=3458414 RepID=UPI004036645F
MKKKVFVSGCYDMLHSGHVAFFKEAATYGDLYVGIGSDQTIRTLKGRETINSEQERLYMVKSIRFVTDGWINSGSDMMDFEEDVRKFRPDIFLVNEDGNSPSKAALCRELGIDYIVLNRIPESGLPARSTTSLRNDSKCQIPYRLDLAGTWIDQPYVSKYHPGWAITISLEPIVEYNERSGMSTSTRNAAKKLWPFQLPAMKAEKLAKLLFHFENEPGRVEVSGAQDSIGICMPGLNRHYYNKKYWPEKIESVHDEETLKWLEDRLYMVMLWPRKNGLNLLKDTQINPDTVSELANAAATCWESILQKNFAAFCSQVKSSFEAQVKMFPHMLSNEIKEVIESYSHKAKAWKLAGAGGGGYLVLVSEEEIPGAMKIKIRRKES